MPQPISNMGLTQPPRTSEGGGWSSPEEVAVGWVDGAAQRQHVTLTPDLIGNTIQCSDSGRIC